MNNTQEEKYIRKRLRSAWWQSVPFYLFRIFPVKKHKVVFTTIEGTTGFTCNPKYIALELIERNKLLKPNNRWELVWLVNDMNKTFPDGIKKVKNTLLNRAFNLTTARFWIDNSRKQLEARKRRNQIYIQTWHAKLGFKPTGLDRGASFSKIAYLVTKHDSDMIDYWLSNSDWYDKTLKTGSIYEGKTLRTGSPRCDILVKSRDDLSFKTQMKQHLCNLYNINIIGNSITEIHFLMYAPTYREGNSEINRKLSTGGQYPDYERLQKSLEQRFGGKWYILLRLHPELVVRHIGSGVSGERLLDGSKVDDMYELLAGCDAFVTDYSSAAFDAAVMEIPVFLYCNDYKKYEGERGKLLWDLRKLPFPLAETETELKKVIEEFDENMYKIKLKKLINDARVVEDGIACTRVVDFIKAQ